MADVLLETAVSNWEPRFTANGVDPSDFTRITAGLEHWNDWCETWCRSAAEHLSLGDEAAVEGRTRSASESYARAATYFHFAKFLFVHDPGQARAAHERSVDALTRALPHFDPPASRHQIAFRGSNLVGVLRTPHANGPHPTVLLIAGLDSTKEEFREVERAFLDRGMATFAFDGPGQGEAEWTLPIQPEWDEVGRAVLDYLAGRHEVDSDRVGVWGVSLGGFYAARLAASDLPVRATIVLSGPYDLGAAWDDLNPLTRHAFEVRSFCDSSEEARRRANDLTLEGHTAKIVTPLLVIMGKRDRLFPFSDGERLAREVHGDSRLVLLDEGNHGCANVVYRHRPFAADWMAARLGVAI